MNLSCIVLVKNEEENIINCLDNLKFSSEIIVVDDNSTDNTPELLEEYSKNNSQLKVYKRALEMDFSAQRKFGIEKAKNDWILFVDADEKITKELADEIQEELSTPDFDAFLIPRVDHMWERKLTHGETGNIRLLRLFDKRKGHLKGKVHEVWESGGKVGQLINPILHYPHPTISSFLKEINFYSDLRAQELFDRRVKTGFFKIILYPKAKFIKNYFFKLGFMDGTAGIVHALLMSFHSFLVRGKLWLLWQKNHTT